MLRVFVGVLAEPVGRASGCSLFGSLCGCVVSICKLCSALCIVFVVGGFVNSKLGTCAFYKKKVYDNFSDEILFANKILSTSTPVRCMY
jgi:hypothetical protein